MALSRKDFAICKCCCFFFVDDDDDDEEEYKARFASATHDSDFDNRLLSSCDNCNEINDEYDKGSDVVDDDDDNVDLSFSILSSYSP